MGILGKGLYDFFCKFIIWLFLLKHLKVLITERILLINKAIKESLNANSKHLANLVRRTCNCLVNNTFLYCSPTIYLAALPGVDLLQPFIMFWYTHSWGNNSYLILPCAGSRITDSVRGTRFWDSRDFSVLQLIFYFLALALRIL